MTITLPSSYQLTRPPKDDDELYQVVKAFWGVTIPRDKHCPHHQAPFDAFSTAFFAREPQVLVLGSRGLSGKSQMMSVLGITEAALLGSDANIVGGSENQSQNVLEHMNRAWDNDGAPRQMIRSSQTQKMVLQNNAVIRPLTASQKSVRGPHPARLLLDEIDEMDPEILESAKGQPMPQKNWLGVIIPQQTIMVSTLQYADGTMMKEMARFRDEELPIFEWCYKDTMWAKDGWLDEDFVNQKRREVSKERWRVEYELGEPSIGNRAIDSDAVEKMFSLPNPEPIKKNRDFEQVEYEAPRTDDHDYVVAADWAQAIDWTVITVWDVTRQPIECVYYVRMHRRPYPEMVGWFNKLQKRYNAQGIHDATGLGRVVADMMDARVRNFVMAGRERDDMLSEFVSGVERGQIKAPRIGSFYREILYASVDDLYSRGKDFHLPDSFCSAALAWKLVSHRFPPVDPWGSPKSDTNWMADQLEHNRDILHPSKSWREGEVRSKTQDHEISFT
jgi:hypothetical protein